MAEAGSDGPEGPGVPDGTEEPGEPDEPVIPVGSVKLCIGDFAPRSAGCRGFNVAQSAERRQDVKAVQTASGYPIGTEPESFGQMNTARICRAVKMSAGVGG
ncbi:hypothetical protein HCK01_09535 [Streptomyces sp. AA8]|uniref:hypothetical protein n=1 Tax=Streptomyces telluris TaxID=2720021 RepID=UPI00143B4867|nr:hypothetical protein [Streptomyces telluris]NJP77557.1 hypothetical protein [Streptomyces telluris]